MPEIDSFTGKYRFLSNFYIQTLMFEGDEYPSSENAYQAAKTLNKNERIPFQTQRMIDAAGLDLKEMTPFRAKKAGMELKLRPNWDEDKIEIMQTIIDEKFEDSIMKILLISTLGKELVEGNYWNDTFWGKCKGVGRNELGKALMRKRQKISSTI